MKWATDLLRDGGLLLFCILCVPSVAEGQDLRTSPDLRPHASIVFTGAAPVAESRLSEQIPLGAIPAAPRTNYGVEGAIIGGVAFAIAGMVITNGLCDSDSGVDNCTPIVILAALPSATIGAVLGAFIGGAIPKGDGQEAAE